MQLFELYVQLRKFIGIVRDLGKHLVSLQDLDETLVSEQIMNLQPAASELTDEERGRNFFLLDG